MEEPSQDPAPNHMADHVTMLEAEKAWLVEGTSNESLSESQSDGSYHLNSISNLAEDILTGTVLIASSTLYMT